MAMQSSEQDNKNLNIWKAIKNRLQRIWTYQDVAPLSVMISNNILVLRPNRAPKAIASADAAMWTPASNWLTIFTPLENDKRKQRL